jgi:hypothetical protein
MASRPNNRKKANPANKSRHGGFGQFGGVGPRVSRKVSHASNRTKEALQRQAKKTSSGGGQ